MCICVHSVCSYQLLFFFLNYFTYFFFHFKYISSISFLVVWLNSSDLSDYSQEYFTSCFLSALRFDIFVFVNVCCKYSYMCWGGGGGGVWERENGVYWVLLRIERHEHFKHVLQILDWGRRIHWIHFDRDSS